MTIDLVLLFNTACAFESAAYRVPAFERARIDEESPVFSWDMAVGTVNSALALELYLKALWAIERSEDPPKTHRLDLLFHGLTSQTQDALSAAYAESSPVRWGVAEMLVSAADLFVAARCAHEAKRPNSMPRQGGVYEIWSPGIFRERILELRPDLNLQPASDAPWA